MSKKFKSSQPQLKVYWFLQRKYAFIVLNLLNFCTKKSRSMLRLDRKKSGIDLMSFPGRLLTSVLLFCSPKNFCRKKTASLQKFVETILYVTLKCRTMMT